MILIPIVYRNYDFDPYSSFFFCVVPAANNMPLDGRENFQDKCLVNYKNQNLNGTKL